MYEDVVEVKQISLEHNSKDYKTLVFWDGRSEVEDEVRDELTVIIDKAQDFKGRSIEGFNEVIILGACA
jgi:hypothetical protein